MLDEKDMDIPDKLLSTLAGLLSDHERLAAMSATARTQAHPGAAERIADLLAELRRAGSAPIVALWRGNVRANKKPACRSKRAFL